MTDIAANEVGGMRLPPGPLRLGYLYSSTMRLLHQLISRRLAGNELTPPQFGALMLIFHAPRLSLRELARYTMGDSPTLCRILDRLERRDLVRRAKSVTDRRYLTMALTPRGRRLAASSRTTYDDLERALLAGFEAHEIDTLRALLTRVLRNAMSLATQDQDAP
jgi:DNA-binding MarR family transcriptional regulator